MGYNVNTIGGELTIAPDKLDACFEALKALNKRNDLKGGAAYSGGKKVEVYFAWMDPDYDQKCKSAAEIFEQLGFEVEENDTGLHVHGYDSKAGDEDHFLEAAAPFATPGSYLEWEGEDGERWRQDFDGTSITSRTGRTEWY